MAEVGHKIMLALGYNEYGKRMARHKRPPTEMHTQLFRAVIGAPSSVVPLQSNMVQSTARRSTPICQCVFYHAPYLRLLTNVVRSRASPPHPLKRPFLLLSHLLWGYNTEDKARLERTAEYPKNGDGYSKQQSTQPQTLGYNLSDSPSGLLAWIYEKLYRWTDNYPWTDDESTLSFLFIHSAFLPDD
jgi:hypothetical protein